MPFAPHAPRSPRRALCQLWQWCRQLRARSRRLWHHIVPLMLLAAGVAAPAWSATAAGGPLPTAAVAADAVDAQLVARVVYGILSYTHWPHARSARVLCAVGDSQHAAALAPDGAAAMQARIQFRSASVDEVVAQQPCDAIYIGQLQPAQLRALLHATAGHPVVTIMEHSQYCDEGAMICLQARAPDALSFQVNLDVVSLSGVRVSPQVLKMSVGQGAPATAP